MPLAQPVGGSHRNIWSVVGAIVLLLIGLGYIGSLKAQNARLQAQAAIQQQESVQQAQEAMRPANDNYTPPQVAPPPPAPSTQTLQTQSPFVYSYPAYMSTPNDYDQQRRRASQERLASLQRRKAMLLVEKTRLLERKRMYPNSGMEPAAIIDGGIRHLSEIDSELMSLETEIANLESRQ